MERVKVVQIIADSDLGGGPAHVLGLLRHLNQKIFEPYLICPRGYLSKETKSVKGVQVFEIPMHSRFDLVSLLQIKSTLHKIQAKGDPFAQMIVHSHGPRAGYLARLIMPRRMINVYTEHLYSGEYHLKNKFNELLQKRILKRLNKKSDAVIAVSNAVRNFLVNEGLSNPKRTLVIPNAIDLPDDFDKPNKIKTGASNPIIGTIGNLNFQKGHSYLIDAMTEISGRYPHATLEIIGEGEEREFLREKIKNAGLEHHVTLLGKKSNIEKHLKNWSVFVLPSLSETFGIVALEAMANGVPIVASKVGGIKDLITNKKNGLLINPKNSDEIAKSVLDILDHPADAAKYKREGLKRAKDFDWNLVIQKIETLYKFLADLEKKSEK